MRQFQFGLVIFLTLTLVLLAAADGMAAKDRPVTQMFGPENSSNIKALFDTELFEEKVGRRNSWDLSESGELLHPPGGQPMFPFPIVTSYKKKNLIKTKKITSIPRRRQLRVAE
jgi:hypothetical protein